MAETERSRMAEAEGPGPPPSDPLIDALSQFPGALAFDGYVGTSTRDGHVLLCRDLSRQFALDIPADQIVYWKSVEPDGAPHPLTVVWVRHDAPVKPTMASPDARLAEFLSGEFPAEAFVDGSIDLPPDFQAATQGPSALWCAAHAAAAAAASYRHDTRPQYFTKCR